MSQNSLNLSPKYKFQTSDDDIFEMDQEILNLSSVLREMVSVSSPSEVGEVIRLELVSSRIFQMILEWAQLHFKSIRLDECRREAAAPKNILDEVYAKSLPKDEPYKLDAWQINFLDLDPTTLRDLIMAANYLHIQELMDMCCKFIASKIVGKTTEQLRQMFNIVNDFTPEEEEKLREEFKYCDDQDF